MKADLLLLEDLHQSTTPGPWYQFGLPWFRDELGVLAGSDDPHVATLVADLTPLEALDDDSRKWAQNPADARFMVEAHRLLPALISELRAAREVVDRLDPGHLNLAGNRLDPDGLRMPFYAASNALTAYLAAYPRQVEP